MLKHSFKSLIATGMIAALLVTSGCTLADRLERYIDGTPRAVPDELLTVWEVWEVLSQDYASRDQIDQSELSRGAIQGMLDALGDTDPDFLTPNRYRLDDPDLGAVWQVWDIIVQEYGGVDRLDTELLSQAAVEGMLSALGNRYMSYLTPAAYSLQTDDYSLAFEGIGAHVNIIEGRLTIISSIPDTPAEQAGLSAGDVILEVDDESIEGLGLAEAVLKVRGPKGTPVQLLVLHPEQEQPEIVTVVRGLIEQPSVLWEALPEGTAYLWIRSFVQETGDELEEALREITTQEIQGMILDLRRNLGGLLDATVDSASQFLDKGLILYQVDGHGNRTDSSVHGDGIALEIPMVVLIDGATASGAEVLAGALRDHQRATLIGSQSFGKGSVNILRRLSNGSAIDLTFALWYTPNGELIEGAGLTPDVVVPMDIRIPLGSTFDVQLFMARDLLQSQIAVPAS